MESNNTVLHPCAFGLAAGITWALGVFFFGVLAWWFGFGLKVQETIASVYVGFDTSLLGTLVGTLWAFIDGFVGGIIFAYLYNMFNKLCCKKASAASDAPTTPKA